MTTPVTYTWLSPAQAMAALRSVNHVEIYSGCIDGYVHLTKVEARKVLERASELLELNIMQWKGSDGYSFLRIG